MEKILNLKRTIMKRDWLLAVVVAIGFILLTIGIGYYSNLVIPGNVGLNARYLQEPATHLDFMSEWDGPHYLAIATNGYTNQALLTAFFPLYPLLIHLVIFVLYSPLISALVISWLSLIGAVYFYIKIIKQLISRDRLDIVMGVLLFLFFPTGVFLVATYTESLFALASLGALYFALKGRYLSAGAMTALATATHPNGVFVIALVALLLWEAKQKLWHIVAASALGTLGIISYATYLWLTKGRPLAFIHAQKSNHWLNGHYLTTLMNSVTVIDLIIYLLAIAATFYWWKRRKSFAIYSFIYVLLPLIGGNFAGFSRYTLMAFPIQLMLLDKFRQSRLAYPLIMIASTVLWSYFVIHYAAGYTGGS